MGVLGSLFGGVFLATRGGDKQKQTTPPIQASSKDEETFIQYVPALPIACVWMVWDILSGSNHARRVSLSDEGRHGRYDRQTT
jgi:F-type H+-transporting ATPase subunit k